METVQNQVMAIWADYIEQPVESIRPETKLRGWDKVDSLDLAEFYCELEDEFGVEIPDKLCVSFSTVGEIVEHITSTREKLGIA